MKYAARHLILWTVLLNSPFAALAAGTDEIDAAMRTVDAGRNEALKSLVTESRLTVFDDNLRKRAVASLPVAIRDKRITQGKALQRVDAVYVQVSKLHQRTLQEVFLYKDDVPSAKVWHGCVLLVSSGLVEGLNDAELTGILAHELSHAYFEDQMASAIRSRDERAMRIVELQCDGVAILSLRMLGYRPAALVGGLQRIHAINVRLGLSESIVKSHPEYVTRAQFAERVIKLMS